VCLVWIRPIERWSRASGIDNGLLNELRFLLELRILQKLRLELLLRLEKLRLGHRLRIDVHKNVHSDLRLLFLSIRVTIFDSITLLLSFIAFVDQTISIVVAALDNLEVHVDLWTLLFASLALGDSIDLFFLTLFSLLAHVGNIGCRLRFHHCATDGLAYLYDPRVRANPLRVVLRHNRSA